MSARPKVSAFGPEAAARKIRNPVETRALEVPRRPVRLATRVPRPIVTKSGAVILPPTVCVKLDDTGLAAIFMRAPDGRELEHPISAKTALRMAYDLLLAASRTLKPTGLTLAINALRGVVHARQPIETV